MKKSGSTGGQSASELIDTRIAELADWRWKTLSRMRTLIKQEDPDGVEEWKWRGTPGWSHDGNTRRAIDIHEGEDVDARAFKALIREAVRLNTSSGKKKPRRAE